MAKQKDEILLIGLVKGPDGVRVTCDPEVGEYLNKKFTDMAVGLATAWLKIMERFDLSTIKTPDLPKPKRKYTRRPKPATSPA